MKIVRLRNGELILGDVTEKDDKVIIEEPLHVVIEDEYKFVNVLKPISNDTSITVDKSEVLYMVNPNEKVASYHNTTFSSVVTPRKKKLIV